MEYGTKEKLDAWFFQILEQLRLPNFLRTTPMRNQTSEYLVISSEMEYQPHGGKITYYLLKTLKYKQKSVSHIELL